MAKKTKKPIKKKISSGKNKNSRLRSSKKIYNKNLKKNKPKKNKNQKKKKNQKRDANFELEREKLLAELTDDEYDV